MNDDCEYCGQPLLDRIVFIGGKCFHPECRDHYQEETEALQELDLLD